MEVIKHDFRRKKSTGFRNRKEWNCSGGSAAPRKVLLSFIYDGNDKLEKEEILKKLESRDSVEVVLGELPEEMLDSLDLVVLSPGCSDGSAGCP